MPDLPGLIVGGASVICLILAFVYCEDLGNGNVERMKPPAPPEPGGPKNESSGTILVPFTPTE